MLHFFFWRHPFSPGDAVLLTSDLECYEAADLGCTFSGSKASSQAAAHRMAQALDFAMRFAQNRALLSGRNFYGGFSFLFLFLFFFFFEILPLNMREICMEMCIFFPISMGISVT